MRTPLLAVMLALAVAPATALAGPPAPPMELPAPGERARAAVESGRWLVGARPGAAADAIATRHGARRVLRAGAIFRVPVGRARAFAFALRERGLLEFAEADGPIRRSAFPQDPNFGQQQISTIVDPVLTPPLVSSASPLIAILDAQIAPHPEFEGGNLVLADAARPVAEWHGTAVASVAGAAFNGRPMVGVWPGSRLLGIDTPTTCSGSARAIDTAVSARASVLNMSYGGPACYAEYVATQVASRAGALLVAAGGNEFQEGNEPEYPASYAHVVTVASVDRDGRSSRFSNENEGIDVSAPGEDILVAVPPQLDPDGNSDGYATVDGTSFAAPAVAAAAAWVRAVRPRLLPDQVASVLRAGARDLGDEGWDQATGYGLLQLNGALNARADAAEPREPNDDIPFVDGTYFPRPDPLLFGRRASRRAVSGALDQGEDPSDVLRIELPARRAVRVTLRTRVGDADLAVYSRSARTIDRRRGLLGRSIRSGRATDSLRVANRSSRTRTAYVAVYIDRSLDRLDASYRLSVSRSH